MNAQKFIKKWWWTFAIIIAGLAVYDAARASGGHNKNITINNYYEENVSNVTNHTGISGSDFNSTMAQLLAGDAIHCTTSTRRHQMGIGGGYSEGKNGGAIGYCNTFLVTKESTHMLGFKAMGAKDAKPRYNFGYNWTF